MEGQSTKTARIIKKLKTGQKDAKSKQLTNKNKTTVTWPNK
jgi:hypothetical protein